MQKSSQIDIGDPATSCTTLLCYAMQCRITTEALRVQKFSSHTHTEVISMHTLLHTYPSLLYMLLSSTSYCPRTNPTTSSTAPSRTSAAAGRTTPTAPPPSATLLLTREFPARRTPTKAMRQMISKVMVLARVQATTWAQRVSFLKQEPKHRNQ